MTNDVLISVKGTQMIDNEDDSIEIITTGTWHEKNGKHFIRYDEAIEGLDVPAHNMVKIQPGLVEVTKKGAIESRMVFEPGKKHMASYHIPMGLLMLGITTAGIEVDLDQNPERIQVRIRYSLEMNGQYVSDCAMEISARVREP